MKFNMKTFKVLLALVISIGIIFWTVNLVRPRSYEGANLNFSVGGGTVSITNPSQQAIAVQLLGTGTRGFRVASTIEGVSGSSTREGSGINSTQLFEFELPLGTSELTISNGKNVTFVANTTTMLNATVHPMSDSNFTTILVVTVIVVLGSLYYASNATDHVWISWLRSQFASIENISEDDTAAPAPATADSGQGQSLRSFGDNRNRAKTGD